MAIDHYSKWCEAKAVADHGAKTAARFLEDDIICRYGVPKFILTDNGGEWAAEFELMCKDYEITVLTEDGLQASMKTSCSMWSKHKRNKGRPTLPKKVSICLRV